MGRKNKNRRGPLTPKNSSAAGRPSVSDALQLFGFPASGDGGPIPDYGDSVCMCTEVVAGDITDLAARGISARVGQFIVSAGESCASNQLFGPFGTKDDAASFAREKFGVERWLTAPVGF